MVNELRLGQALHGGVASKTLVQYIISTSGIHSLIVGDTIIGYVDSFTVKTDGSTTSGKVTFKAGSRLSANEIICLSLANIEISFTEES